MKLFNLKNKNAVILGGGGVLGTTMAKGLSDAGANIAVCDLHQDSAIKAANEAKTDINKTKGYALDAMSLEDTQRVCNEIISDFGSIDVLVNAVGGNMKAATTAPPDITFFDLDGSSISKVVDLNLIGGAIMPSQVFGKKMVDSEDGGVIINISSMNAFRPLTRIPGYSAAKAAVSNFTQWLSTELCQAYGDKIRVNAIAPGFFLTNQNRFLLTDEKTGELTPRGQQIISHTPMDRFGSPDDLVGTLVWLASDASKFVTGIVVPVDGGFSAYSGV